ncbi:MAG: SH3 domain-containing protein [Saprospiraceae bacterium]
MLPITLDLLTNNRNRPYLRNAQEYAIRQLRGIVVHATDQFRLAEGSAQAVRQYFNSSAMFVSAHYVVDAHQIIQCVPDNEVAYHVGANQYRPDGERVRGASTLSPNYFLIGLIICTQNAAEWDKTCQNAVDLAARLLRKYRFTITDLYRQYDITGKGSPQVLLAAADWSKFRTDVIRAMSELPKSRMAQGRVIAEEAAVRTGPGFENPALSRMYRGDLCDIIDASEGWLHLGERRWIRQDTVEMLYHTRLGRVTERTGINLRSGPGANFPVVDALPHLAFTDVIGQQDKWLELSPRRWAHGSMVEVVQVRYGEVVGTDALNVRSGPGTTYPVVKRLGRLEKVQIFDIQDKWLLIGNSEWVYAGFVQEAGRPSVKDPSENA